MQLENESPSRNHGRIDNDRQGSASSAITEKREDSEARRRLIITDRIMKDKDNID